MHISESFSKRQTIIINTILSGQIQGNIFTTMETLIKKTNVSSRTVSNDISNINNLLEQHNLKIVNKRNLGYYFEYDSKQQFETLMKQTLDHSEFSLENPSDRIKSLLMKLLYSHSYITIEDLSDSIFVSNNTIYSYLKEFEDILESHHLAIESKSNHGIKIIGDEFNKQDLIFSFIIDRNSLLYPISITSLEKYFFDERMSQKIFELIKSCFNANNKNIIKNDFQLKDFYMHTLILIDRLQHGFYLDKVYPKSKTLNYFGNNTTVDELILDLEKELNIKFTDSDIDALRYFYINDFRIVMEINDTLFNDVFNFVHELLLFIHQTYSINLRDDEELVNNLIKHILPVVRQKKHYENISIKEMEYYDIINTFYFNMTKSAINSSTSPLKVFFDDKETAYISFYIATAFEKKSKITHNRKNAILVCGSGYATSGFIEIRLKKELGSLVNVVKRISYNDYYYKDIDFQNIDLIFTTVPLQGCVNETPIIYISLDNFDENLRSIKKNKGLTDTASFQDFFDSRLFLTAEDKTNEEVIEIMAIHLQNLNYTKKNLAKSVLEREKLSSTRMADAMAVPHPIDTSASTTKVCVLTSKKGIVWDENGTVNLIFLLSINPEEKNIDFFYDKLISVIQNPDIQEKIISANNPKEFMTYINEI